MATLGPTATTVDVSSFANFATWAGTGTFGIHTALANFGWTQTVDSNQITFATATAVPFSGAAGTTYPLTNMPSGSYIINTRGNWVSGTNYAVGDVVYDTTTHSSYYTFLAITNSTTVPSSDATHFFVYHYEMWQTNDSVTFAESAQSVSYVSSTQTLTIGTTTNPNRFKAGFVVTISGASSATQINGTWCIASATTTQLTFTIPNTLTGFNTGNFSATDSYTLAYSFQPIVMKLEYFGNTSPYSTAPWVRVSFGNGTDGVGNLTGNVVGSTNCGNANTTSFNNQGFIYLDLVSGQTGPSGAQTSSIWRCIASGSNGRFGACLFYNRNDTNAANTSALTWLVERAKDNSGNDIDDYYTYIAGCFGSTSTIFGSSQRYWNQRSILKWNPNVLVSTVTVDSANDLIVWYSNFSGAGSYNFAIGTTVFLGGLSYASFLNDQFVLVNANSLTLTSVANASGGNTVYTGTITGGTTNAYLNQKVTVSGFTTGANNGTFTCVASTATTITLNNASGTAETHAATVTGNFFIASFTHAAYATQPDNGTAYLSISSSVPTPIAGTGLPCQSDPCVCTIERNLSSLQVNGQTPLLPAFPVPGFLGNPMTMLQIVSGGDQPGHDTTFSIVLYGATRTYYFPQGVTSDPFQRIGDPSAGSTLQAYGFAMRWD